jgi:hypothetical protein
MRGLAEGHGSDRRSATCKRIATWLDFWGWAQDRLIDIGRALPAPARQTYVNALSDSAD